MIRAEIADDPLLRRVRLYLLDDAAPADVVRAALPFAYGDGVYRLTYGDIAEATAVPPTLELTYAELDALTALLAPRAATALDAAETVRVERRRVDLLLDAVVEIAKARA